VEWSKALLTHLGDERECWETGSQNFKSQMSTISGDVLLTSAFMGYGSEGFEGNWRKQWRRGGRRKGVRKKEGRKEGRKGVIEEGREGGNNLTTSSSLSHSQTKCGNKTVAISSNFVLPSTITGTHTGRCTHYIYSC